MTAVMDVQNLTVNLHHKTILQEVTFQVEAGEVLGILGANGAGKTTLLRTLYRSLPLTSGTVLVQGQPLNAFSARQYARQVAVVVQDTPMDLSFQVLDYVLIGRCPHKKLWEQDTPQDIQMAREALSQVGLTEHQSRNLQHLSGGEKQRVFLARALCQQAEVLILDEPTNHLDVRYQQEVLGLIRTLGKTVVVSLHDVNLAAQHCDRLLLLHQGKLLKAGTPEEVLTQEWMKAAYGVQVTVQPHPVRGTPLVVF